MDRAIGNYARNLVFPVLWLILMTMAEAADIVRPEYADYFFALYFGGFFVYFVFIRKCFCLKEFISDLFTFSFWKHTLLCIILLAAFYGIGTLPAILFPNHNLIFVETSFVRAYDLPSKIAFFFSAILFPGLGQELFYRKSIVCFANKKTLVASTLIGALLFAINDNLNLYGMFRSFLVGLAFAFPYIKTRSINPSVFAHYFVSITMTLLF